MAVEARLFRLDAVFGLAVSGERNEQHAIAVVRTQPLRHFVAVDSREPDVHEHAVGRGLLREVDAGRAVVRDVHLVSLQAQQHREPVRTRHHAQQLAQAVTYRRAINLQ